MNMEQGLTGFKDGLIPEVKQILDTDSDYN